jgi:hypothetical protein
MRESEETVIRIVKERQCKDGHDKVPTYDDRKETIPCLKAFSYSVLFAGPKVLDWQDGGGDALNPHGGSKNHNKRRPSHSDGSSTITLLR